ncbi:MAG: NAD(P)H-quinone oxidoreductase [Sphingobacterium sp.]
MKAAVITKFGGPEVLEIQTRDDLKPGKNQVVVKVEAAGVNRPDVFQRKGNYPAPPGVIAEVPGLEVAGIVIARGEQANRWPIGTEVMALLPGGGYATQACVHQDLCIAKPEQISFEEAACLPETLYTVWHNVFRLGALEKDQWVLIHGGTGGIGSTAIQLAKYFGARVAVTVGSEEKVEIARSLGADQVINYRQNDFSQVLDESSINLVLDSIGGNYFAKNIHVLGQQGRLVQINAMQGAKVELNLLQLMQKRIWLTGSTLRARDHAFKEALTREIETQVIPLVQRGDFRPLMGKIFSFQEVADAHRYFDSPGQFGKIALTMRS